VPWFYYIGRLVARGLLILFTRWQVRGKENIPKDGPLLVVANHIGIADPPLLSASINRKTVFMGKEELFRPRITGYLIRNFGAFPVHRGRLDRQALRHAEEVLAHGLALIMFPEGRRSRRGVQLQPALPGSALIAARSRARILPVGITGTEQIRGKAWLVRRPCITVNIGQPFTLPPGKGQRSKAELAEEADLITHRIADLLPEEYKVDWNENRKSG
jgi:1-acyl-sn-glycerol-3-phosphate acyltransferase